MGYEIGLESRSEQPAAVVRARVRVEGFAGFIGSAFAEVMAAVTAQGLTITGPPFGRYHMLDGEFDVEAGFPTSSAPLPIGRVEPSVLPAGEVATTVHVGSYDDLAAAHDSLQRWLAEHDLVPTGDPWESYLDGPEVARPRTVLSVPCTCRPR